MALETGEYTAEEIKHLAFLRASAQYQASTIDDSAFQTEKLRKAILGQDIQHNFSKELFRKTIRKIVVYEEGRLCFFLINGVILETRVGSSQIYKREEISDS